MKTKIKLLKDYGDHKAGEMFTVEKAGADTLLAEGVAEIVISEVELTKETDLIKKEISDTVKEVIKAEIKGVLPVVKMDEPVAFDSIGDFFLAQKEFNSSGEKSEGLILYEKQFAAKAPSGNNTLINTEGGYLVPEEFNTILMDKVQGQAVIAPMTTNVPINSRIKLPYILDNDKSASWAGGVTVAWGNEGSQLTNSEFEVDQVELSLKKMNAYVTVTDELMDDSASAVGTIITKLTSIALAKELDEQIVNGTGVGRPLGFLNAPALITVAKVSGQDADTINTTNVTQMWQRQANPGNAVWLVNRDCMEQIYKLNLAVGTAGGSNVFMFNIAERQSETIFGAPIVWTEHAQTLGDLGDINCVDMAAYLYASKAGQQIKSASSIHVRFITDEQVFKFTQRVDGQPWWKTAQTPKHGTSTISPFVSLAARA